MSNKMKVGPKLIGGFALVALIAGAIGFIGFSNTGIQIAITIIGLMVAMALGIGLTQSLTRSMVKISTMLQELSQGRLGSRMSMNDRQDEIGMMAQKLDQFADDLQKNVVGVMKKIADGDLSADVKPKDAQDEIGLTLQKMIQRLRTNKTEVEAALTDARYKAEILNKLPTPVLSVDRDMNVQYINAAAAGVAGGSPESCLGKKCYDLLRNPHCQTGECRTARAMQQNGTFSGDTVISRSGKDIFIAYTGLPLKDAQGNILGAVEQAFDITETKTVVNEVNTISRDLKEGHLSVRAKLGTAQGDNKVLLEMFNSAINGIMEPVNEALKSLSEMAKGNLTLEVQGDYQGDHAILKNAINDTLNSLNDLLTQVSQAVEQVSSGSQQGVQFLSGAVSGRHGTG